MSKFASCSGFAWCKTWIYMEQVFSADQLRHVDLSHRIHVCYIW